MVLPLHDIAQSAVRGGGGESKGVVVLQSILFTNKDNHTKNTISCEHDTFKVICVIFSQIETM
jgi:hypothetical protein